MRAVVQRVINASVKVEGVLKGGISFGLLVYLGVALDDNETDADWLAEKIANLRIFEDAEGKMNLSILEVIAEGRFAPQCAADSPDEESASAASSGAAGVLAVSQFTLLGDARKGRRPSWGRAAPPETAKRLYEYFMAKIRERGLLCESGEFQTHMRVRYTNDGPVTILLDSKESHA
jgi:D-tyrosyl-tRNA(Tyr) deacylase